MTQFSIARHSMGCILNGDHYIYVPQTDELIRADVLKWKKKHEKAKPNAGGVPRPESAPTPEHSTTESL